MEPDDRASTLYGVAIGVLYVFAVGVQVYVVVDEVTHGALTAEVKRRWARVTAVVTERRRIDREVAEGAPWVIFEAQETIRETGA